MTRYRSINHVCCLALVVVIIVSSVATQTALAELPTLIPRVVLFGDPEKEEPAISPDGKLLAYLAPDQGVMNVWVHTLGQQDDHVVTSDRNGLEAFFWRPDSAHILYTQDQNGDENSHLYQTDLRTRETRDLTPFKGVRVEILSLDPRFPDQMLVQMNKRDPAVFDVYRFDLNSGQAELEAQNPGGVSQWGADNHLHVRAQLATLPDGGAEVRVRDEAKSPWRVLLRVSADDFSGTDLHGFSPDEQNLWLVSSVGANAARLVEINLATARQRVLAEDEQYDVDQTLLNPRKHTLEAVRFMRARSEWKLLDQTLKDDFDAIGKVRNGDFNIVSRDDADQTWIVSYVADNSPICYYTYHRRTRRAERLFSRRPALEKYALARQRPISFRARDGMTIYGYLTLPVGVEPKGLPMVLLVHGGPWSRDVWSIDNQAQWLANRGYGVLQVNFRGSSGYGKKYLQAAVHEWGGKMHDDLIDGVNWAVRQGYVDPKRVGIMGFSYGGYAALVGLTFTPEVFACGVDMFGPSNLITHLKTVPPYWKTGMAFFQHHLGNPDDPADIEDLKARSPLYKVGRIRAPLLIEQGANDPRVKQAESDQIVAAMRQANKSVEYILYPDEGHGFAHPANRLHISAKTEEFLAKYLGGRFEPMGDIKGYSGVMK